MDGWLDFEGIRGDGDLLDCLLNENFVNLIDFDYLLKLFHNLVPIIAF